MKRLVLSFIGAFLLFFASRLEARAIYDPLSVPNNKVGLHIFDPGEIGGASKLVNGNGGEWGYVTVPIRSDDRNRERWQRFMNKARELKVIPILRLSTYVVGESWVKPSGGDILDFVNFLSGLSWPTQNRYVIIFNEPNQANEWGGEVNPEEYARVLRFAASVFKSRSDDFFILPAGLDSAAPDSDKTLSSRKFILRMVKEDPDIFSLIDGWTSHSYPNPGFSGYPTDKGWRTIVGYRYETAWLRTIWLRGRKLPIFITETGWQHEDLPIGTTTGFLKEAFREIWSDLEIVAITPFVYSAYDGPFAKFSFLDKGRETPLSKMVTELPKVAGKPVLDNSEPPSLVNDVVETSPPVKQGPTKSIIDVFSPLLRFFRL